MPLLDNTKEPFILQMLWYAHPRNYGPATKEEGKVRASKHGINLLWFFFLFEGNLLWFWNYLNDYLFWNNVHQFAVYVTLLMDPVSLNPFYCLQNLANCFGFPLCCCRHYHFSTVEAAWMNCDTSTWPCGPKSMEFDKLARFWHKPYIIMFFRQNHIKLCARVSFFSASCYPYKL